MTVLASQPALHTPQRTDRVLPLVAGDHLTRAEFERRYAALPNVKKAELVDGVVFMPSPVGNTHSTAHAAVVGWLFAYCIATPGVRLGDNATVRLDADNEVQPDALLRLDKDGRSRVDADDLIAGAPELVVEIASSSASYDLHEKLHVYRRNGVQEYIVWRTLDRVLDWFVLEAGRYTPQTPDEYGRLHSRIFPGLTLAVGALLAGDLAAVLAAQRSTAGHK